MRDYERARGRESVKNTFSFLCGVKQNKFLKIGGDENSRRGILRLFLNFPSIFIPKSLIHVIPIVIVKVPKVFATVRSSLPLSLLLLLLLLLLLSLLQTFYLFSLFFLQAQRVIRRDVDGPDDASDSTAVKNT